MIGTEPRGRIQVFIGVDVGKRAHHAVALDVTDKRLLDSTLPNDEAKLRALITQLKEHGSVLLVVDQLATISELPVGASGRSRSRLSPETCDAWDRRRART